jgi:hypothetical protein
MLVSLNFSISGKSPAQLSMKVSIAWSSHVNLKASIYIYICLPLSGLKHVQSSNGLMTNVYPHLEGVVILGKMNSQQFR